MMLILLAYMAILRVEWGYLSHYTRQARTKVIVLGVIALSFCYILFVYYAKDVLPSPNATWVKLLGPIQKMLLAG